MFKACRFLSVYIHIPFCRKRCGYCDFNTYAGMDHLQQAYVKALIQEAKIVHEHLSVGNKVHTIFFGGGTPSHLGVKKISEILNSIADNYEFADDMEISLEMNPWASSVEEFAQYQKIGINRLSIGMQSADPTELKILSRDHTHEQVISSVKRAQKAGISNINLDLIFGIPGQTQKSFEHSIDLALALAPKHLSLYALSIEEGTPLARKIELGEVAPPDQDLAADMYEFAMDYLEGKGFIHYEISNWAWDEKYFCRHNLQYWKNGDYLGFGAGAHSLFDGRRWSDDPSIPSYIQAINQFEQKTLLSSPVEQDEVNLTQTERIGEMMIMGLRLVRDGVCEADFYDQSGKVLEDYFKSQIIMLEKQGLLEWNGESPNRHLRLTRKGRLLGNQVFMQFLPDEIK